METKQVIRREIAARRKAAEESFLREASQKIAEAYVAAEVSGGFLYLYLHRL